MRVTTLLVDAPTLSFEERARLAAREATAEVMSAAPHPADLVALAAEAVALAEGLAVEARKTRPPPRPIACGAGCSHCCHLSVVATPAETLRLAAHVRNRFTSEMRAAVLDRLREAAALSGAERAARHLPCPLLVEDRCSAYEVRPLNCRRLESMDADACRRASLGEKVEAPIDKTRFGVFNSVISGVLAGSADSGRGAEQLDLFAALLIALEAPDAPRRWLRGEPVFAGAHWTTRPESA
jgi:hypothetical protein